MAHVSLIGNLRQFTGGVSELEVEAANVRQLFARLGEKFPTLAAPRDGLGRCHRRADLSGCAVSGDQSRQRRAHPSADCGGLTRAGGREQLLPTPLPLALFRQLRGSPEHPTGLLGSPHGLSGAANHLSEQVQ